MTRTIMQSRHDGPLHVERDGFEDGTRARANPVVVLVNSWGTSARSWRAVRAALRGTAPTGTAPDVIAYDPRGCGRSVRPTSGVDIAMLTDDVIGLCERLARPIVLAGASIGAIVALETADRLPAVRGVVVFGGPGHWGTKIPEVLDGFHATLHADRCSGLDELAGGMLGPNAGPKLKTCLRADLDAVDLGCADLFLEQRAYDPRPMLGRIDVPVRYVHGELDAVVPPQVAREHARLTGRHGSPVRLVDGAGHLVHLERPEVAAAEIADLLREVA